MEIFGYAWFIYVLTILLLISIFFIIVLILVKCVQTIIHARIFCCKKKTKRHRPDCSRQRRRSQQNNVTISSLSTSSSCSCSYISTSSSSSDDSDSECCQNNRHNSNNNRTRVWNAYDNIGFSTSCEPNLDLNMNTNNNNVINRKYDDKNRYTNVNLNAKIIPKVIIKKRDDQAYHQISIIPTKCSYLAITKKNDADLSTKTNLKNKQISDFIHSYSISTGSNNSLPYLSTPNRSYTINTCSYISNKYQNNIKESNLRCLFKNKSFNENKIYDDVTNLFDPIIANLNDNQEINSCMFDENGINNFSNDESLSIKFEMDNEIPPPYSQVIRESTV
jgi:hypothetical protein